MLSTENPRYDEAVADLVEGTVMSFLDRYLRGDADALDGIAAELEDSKLATFETNGAA